MNGDNNYDDGADSGLIEAPELLSEGEPQSSADLDYERVADELVMSGMTWGSVVDEQQFREALGCPGIDYGTEQEINANRLQYVSRLERLLEVLSERYLMETVVDGPKSRRVLLPREQASALRERRQRVVNGTLRKCARGLRNTDVTQLDDEQKRELTDEIERHEWIRKMFRKRKRLTL